MIINSRFIFNERKARKINTFFSVTVSENVPVRRSRRLARMDVNGNKLSSPEGSDNEMDTANVNK